MMRLVLLALVASLVVGAPAHAQVAGTSCTVAGATAAPDANGNNLRCVSGTWTVVSGGGGSPAGTSGAVQFTNGTAFTADAANLFWDNTNKRLGIGTTGPSELLHVNANQNAETKILISNSNAGASAQSILRLTNDGTGLFHFGFASSGFAAPFTNQAYVWSNNSNGILLSVSDANPIKFSTNNTERMRISATGSVGIGTTVPGVRLDVAGAILSRSIDLGSGTTVDWAQGNNAFTTANCGSFTFSNMQDGGVYTLAVRGATAATCSFTHSGLTFRLPPGHGATTASSHTLYSFIRLGTIVYVTWRPGFI